MDSARLSGPTIQLRGLRLQRCTCLRGCVLLRPCTTGEDASPSSLGTCSAGPLLPLPKRGRKARCASSQAEWPSLRSRHQILRSEEHTSELQSLAYLVCRLLLEKKKNKQLLNR